MPGYIVHLIPEKPNKRGALENRFRSVAVWADDKDHVKAIIKATERGWEINDIVEDI